MWSPLPLATTAVCLSSCLGSTRAITTGGNTGSDEAVAAAMRLDLPSRQHPVRGRSRTVGGVLEILRRP